MATYKVKVEPDGPDSPLIVIIVVIILAAIVGIGVSIFSESESNYESKKSSSNEYASAGNNTHTLQNNSSESNVAVGSNNGASLAELYVFSQDNPYVSNIISTSVKDAYGNSYSGPYFHLASQGDYNSTEYVKQGYTELVTGGKYRYLSGTFFAQVDDYASEEKDGVEFLVFADDKLVYSSGEIDRTTKAQDFVIDIGNCETVRVQSRTLHRYSSVDMPAIILVDAKVYN